MPAGDGTGPLGFGPMTGRAAGYCAGYPVPGYANVIPGPSPWGQGGYWGVNPAYASTAYPQAVWPYGYGSSHLPVWGRPFGRGLAPWLGRGWGRGRPWSGLGTRFWPRSRLGTRLAGLVSPYHLKSPMEDPQRGRSFVLPLGDGTTPLGQT